MTENIENQQITTLNFEKICRACLNEGDNKNIFNETIVNEEKINLDEIISTLTNVEVSESDRLPNHVCFDCLTNLYKFYKFKQQCQQSDNTLRYYLNIADSKSHEIPSDNDCIIVEVELDNGTKGLEMIVDKEELVTDAIVVKDEIRSNVKRKRNPKRRIEFVNCVSLKNEGVNTKGKENKDKLDLPFCKRCEIYFATIEDLLDHKRRIKHPRERNHPCPKCKKLFTRSNLKIHMRSHTNEKPYHCNVCDSAFSLKCNLRRHMMLHTGEKPHTCDICGKGFIQSTSLKEHIRTHTGETPFICNFCGKRCNQSGQLKAHILKHAVENGDNVDMPMHKCDICDRVFYSKSILRQHKLIHGEKNYLCSYCGKGFVSPYGLQSHMKVHTGERPYTCSICQKSFGQSGSLKTHMLIHSGVRPYVCKQCGKTFTQRNHLLYHSRIHSGEKPYQCNVCGKRFALNGTLTVHKRIHTGESPYVCPVCGKGFYDSSSMKKHKMGHPQNDDRSSKSIKDEAK